eukprot:scaffold673786_cov60-Prasinocladus_malaysianus.AAC.1
MSRLCTVHQQASPIGVSSAEAADECKHTAFSTSIASRESLWGHGVILSMTYCSSTAAPIDRTIEMRQLQCDRSLA